MSAEATAVTTLIKQVDEGLTALLDNLTFQAHLTGDLDFPGVSGSGDAAVFAEALRRLHEIRAAIVLTDNAHRVAEALEAANPTGAVLGEAERAVIREAL